MTWNSDKTSASIAFVNQAETLMADYPLEDQIRLQTEIDLIKSGQLVLINWMSVSEFLRGPIFED